MTLRVKTSMLIAMILAASLAIMCFLYLRFLERSLKNSIYVGLEGVSHAATEAVSKFLQSTHQAAQSVALDLPTHALVNRNTSTVEDRLKSMVEVFPQFENGIFVLDGSGSLWAD